MRKIYLLIAIIILNVICLGQTTIWSEDFSSYSDYSGYIGPGNITTGDYPASVTKWTLDVSAATLTASSDWFLVHDVSGNLFETRDSDGECIWTSELITISSYSNVGIEVLVSESGDHEATDYVKLYYKIDGGSETMFATNGNNVDDFGSVTASQTGLAGNSLQIVIKTKNNAGSEYLRFDDIVVTGTAVGGVNNPTSFTATTNSTTQINLSWVQNANTDDVMVAWTSDGTFGTPVDGNSYTSGDPITGGGTVIYNGSSTSYNHLSLTSGTQYYYKAWSVDGSDNYSSGVTDDATTYKGEPSNHVTVFDAVLGTPTHSVIDLSWIDAIGDTLPDAYLIKGSSDSYGAIAEPIDGSEESDGGLVLNVILGIQSAQFTGLDESTKYYFKIWPYTNSGTAIDYKLDGAIPQSDATTSAAPVQPTVWINELHYDNDGGDVGEFVEIVIKNPGSYSLSDFQVNLYNGSGGASYDDETVDNFTVGSSTGNFSIYYWEPGSIQNGPDGLAVSYQGSLIVDQFLSYEGSFTATDGPANGVTSTNIGVTESGSTPSGYSLQLKYGGEEYSHFEWQSPAPETKGILNNMQYIGSYTTWYGSTNTDWVTSSNWGNNIPDATMNVIIPEGLTNYPTITVASNCDDIVIESNASGSGSLLGQSNLTVSGNSIVQCYVSAGQWHGISPAVSGQTANELYLGGSPEVWMKEYNETSNDYDYVSSLTTPLGNSKGWMVWIDGSTAQTYEFSGSLRSGSISPTESVVRSQAGADYGFNLVGNPFPSAIDWDAATGWTKTNIADAIYVYNNGSFASYVGGTGAGGGSQYIAMNQGFFVQVNDDGSTTGTLSMTNDIQVHNGVSFMKNNLSNDFSLIRLEVSNGNYIDETVVKLIDGATVEFDGQLDARKLFSFNNSRPHIFTTNGGNMSINSLPPETVEVTLDVIGVDGEEMIIRATELSDISIALLVDELAGKQTDLLSSDYNFIYDKTFTERFKLYFGIVEVDEVVDKIDFCKIFGVNNKISISLPPNVIADIEIYDLLGRKHIGKNNQQGLVEIKLPDGNYYIVRATSSMGNQSQLVIIK